MILRLFAGYNPAIRPLGPIVDFRGLDYRGRSWRIQAYPNFYPLPDNAPFKDNERLIE